MLRPLACAPRDGDSPTMLRPLACRPRDGWHPMPDSHPEITIIRSLEEAHSSVTPGQDAKRTQPGELGEQGKSASKRLTSISDAHSQRTLPSRTAPPIHCSGRALCRPTRNVLSTTCKCIPTNTDVQGCWPAQGAATTTADYRNRMITGNFPSLFSLRSPKLGLRISQPLRG